MFCLFKSIRDYAFSHVSNSTMALRDPYFVNKLLDLILVNENHKVRPAKKLGTQIETFTCSVLAFSTHSLLSFVLFSRTGTQIMQVERTTEHIEL